MGNPSDGKIFDPDRYCKLCNDILLEGELEVCADCVKTAPAMRGIISLCNGFLEGMDECQSASDERYEVSDFCSALRPLLDQIKKEVVI